VSHSQRDTDALLPLTSAVFQILLAVADAPRHGLGILQEVEERTAGSVRLGPGTLYGTLQRMCAAGLLEPTDDRPPIEQDDPRRRYYRISALGRRAARREAERLAALLDVAAAKQVFRRTSTKGADR
jgi:DNA-binding PadR family transcriptional regulator